MKLAQFLPTKSLMSPYKNKRDNLSKKENVKRFSKYKCKMSHVPYTLSVYDDYLLIENENIKHRISCLEIKKVSISEKVWSIRVNLQCKKHLYQFDFPSFKIATKFYEQMIYSKVKVHLH